MALSKIPAAGFSDAVNFRNIIINGDMSIAQRGTSASSVTSTSYNTVDRWNNYISSLGTWTISQDTTVPTGQGFAKSLKYDCTTADASPASNDVNILIQRFEGQNLQYLKKGTSSAESLTLSFWVKSNKTGTYNLQTEDLDNNRSNVRQYSIESANTWEYKTITFEGDISGTINNDNGDGFRLWWWLGSGTGYTGGTMQPGVWRPWSESNGAAPGLSVNMADSTSNEWFITGVQLEVGRNATEFEHRSYGEELALCQRYYYEYPKGNTYNIIANGFANTSSNALFHFQFPVPMRTDSRGFNNW